jgi:O-antigen/teichoic acid export membrane protein
VGERSSGRIRVVLRNLLGLLTARGVSAVAGLVMLAVLFRVLGAGPLGVWVLLTGITNLVALIDLGLGSTIVRAVAGDVGGGVGPRTSSLTRIRVVLGLGLVWGVTLGLLALGATVVAWPWLAAVLHIGDLRGPAEVALVVLLLGILVDGVAMPWRCVLEGRQRYVVLSVINGSTAVLAAGLSVVVVLAGQGLVGLAVVVAGTSVVRAVAVVAVARRRARALSPSLLGLDRDGLRETAGYGLRVQATSATAMVNLEADRFVLGGFFGPSVVAGFELGARWANLFRLIPVYALVAMFPMAVAQSVEHGPDWLDRFQLVATKYLSAAAGLGAAGLVVCADPLIRTWLGQPNAWATKAIMILVPAYAVNLAVGATSILARVEGRPGRETTYAVLATVLNLALTYPLLRLLGPVGVPLATAVGVVVATGYFLVSYQRATRRRLAPVLAEIGRPLLAAFATGLLVTFLAPVLPDGPGSWWAVLAVLTRGIAVVVIMVALLAATGFFDVAERARLAALLRRRSPAFAAPGAGA